MRNLKALSILLMLGLGISAHAQTQVVCKDLRNNAVILQFPNTQAAANIETSGFDLAVTTNQGDVASMNILDKRSSDRIEVKVFEELVIATLTSQGAAPVVKETGTHRGAVSFSIQNPTTQDVAHIQSRERRGESLLQIELATNESANQSLNIQCQKVR